MLEARTHCLSFERGGKQSAGELVVLFFSSTREGRVTVLGLSWRSGLLKMILKCKV